MLVKFLRKGKNKAEYKRSLKIVPFDLTRQEQAYAEIDDFDQKRVWSPSIIRHESAACHN